MAIAPRAVRTLDSVSRTNSSITAPTGTVSGDVLVALVSFIGSPTPTITTPSGWTLVTEQTWTYSGASASGRTCLYRRIADGTSADDLTFTHAAIYTFGEVAGFSGGNATTPLDVAAAMATGTTSAAGQNATATSITPVNNNSMIVTFRHSWDGSAVTPTAGYTELADHAAGHVQYLLQTTAASTGGIAIPSGNTAGLGKPWITATLALRDAAAGDPPPYEPSWEAQVAEAVAGTDQARIMFVGDSFSEGEGVTARTDRWIERLVHDLRTTMGIAGTGLGHTPPRYHTYMTESAGWRSPATASPTIGEKTFSRASGGYFEWTITGTAYTILYNGGSGLGNLSVSTDGGAGETITAQPTGRVHKWNKTGLSSGSHTVRVTAGTGGGSVVGIIAYDSDSPTTGLTYLDWCWTGGSSDEWAAGALRDVTGIQFAPHLVIDGQHGANDYIEATSNPTQVATRFQDRVTEYRSWASMPLVVLFILPHMPAGSEVDESATNALGFTLDQYRDACIAVANTMDVPVVDMRELLTLTLSDLASDNLHMQAAGHQAVADGIRSTLLDLSGYEPIHSYQGSKQITGVYSGVKGVTGIYKGTTLIWPRGSV